MYIAVLALSWVTAFLLFLTHHEIYAIISYGLIVPVLVTMPVVLYRRHREFLRPSWLTLVEKLAFVLVAVDAPGTLYFHERAAIYQYDRLLHLSVGLTFIPLLTLLAVPVVGDVARVRRYIPIIGLVAFVGLFAWEGWQFTNDRLLGTHLFFDHAQPIKQDFWEDIAFGTAGLLLSIPLVRRTSAHLRSYVSERS